MDSALRPDRAPSTRRPFWAAGLLVLGLSACGRGEEEAAPVPVRPVRTTTVVGAQPAQPLTFSGRIEAKDSVDLAFRIGGRLQERLVGVGAAVKEGDVLARLEPETELNELRSARAALSAAQGVLREAEGRFERQSHLYERGVTSRAEFEAAEQGRKAAASQVEAAAAKVRIAEDVVGFTVLKADAPGVVTAIGAEPGEIVAAGRMVVRLARRDGRDAVFDVSSQALDQLAPADRVTVQAVWESGLRAAGRVREVSPEADPVTRLFRIRVGLIDPPPALALGSAVQGQFTPRAGDGVSLPAAALVQNAPQPSVWIVDPATGKLALRSVTVERVDPASAIVSAGLKPGEVVVTAGANGLKAGQQVRLAGGTP